MYIGTLPSQIKQLRLFRILSGGLLLLMVVFSFFSLVRWSFSLGDVSFSEEKASLKPSFSFQQIGYGPLGLCGLKEAHSFGELHKELVVLGLNTRPDENSADRAVLLGLKSSQKEMMAYEGERIHIAEVEPGFFSFSDTPQAIQLSLTIKEDDSVQVEIFSSGVKTSRLVLHKTSFQNRPEALYARSLKEGKCWGRDALLQNYGGEEFRPLTHKMKVEIGDQILFVSEGDMFEWEEERWEPALVDHSTIRRDFQKKPLAYVRSIDAQGVNMEVWDMDGFSSQLYKLPHEVCPKPAYKVEDLFAAVKPRALTEVSCLLGKRRVILKEGDWWLKTAQGWKNLRRERDIEAYLAHQLEGELFIFESIQSEKGKTVLKGQKFDLMRTSMEPLSLTIQADKKASSLASGRKKELHGTSSSSVVAKTEIKKQGPQQIHQHADNIEIKR